MIPCLGLGSQASRVTVSLPGHVLLWGVPWPLPCSRPGTRFHQPPWLFSFDAAEMRSHPASEMTVTVGMCLSFPGGLFFWGATNTSRESTMYPKAVQDLCGWRIRSLAYGYVTMSPVSRMSAPALGMLDTARRCPVPGGLHSSIGVSGAPNSRVWRGRTLLRAEGVGRSSDR